MHTLNIVAKITGVGDTASKALHQVYNHFDLWSSAPLDVPELGNAIGDT